MLNVWLKNWQHYCKIIVHPTNVQYMYMHIYISMYMYVILHVYVHVGISLLH